MTFLISFPSILRKTIGWNVLGLLYDGLLDFGMIIDIKFLKCEE